MSDKESSTMETSPVSAAPVIAGDHLPRIVIFVAGEQARVETAICRARQLYPDYPRVFICEPVHRDWISSASSERVFVIEQPFNPFGRRAADLRKDLESSPIEACALIIAGVGLESLRFRVFALRLRTQRFRLLGGDARNDSKQLDRLSFALLTGVTLPLGRLRKIEERFCVSMYVFYCCLMWPSPYADTPLLYNAQGEVAHSCYDADDDVDLWVAIMYCSRKFICK